MNAVVNPTLPGATWSAALEAPGDARYFNVKDISPLLSVVSRGEVVSPSRVNANLVRGDGQLIVQPKRLTLVVQEASEAEARVKLQSIFDLAQFATGFTYRARNFLSQERLIDWGLQGGGYALSDWRPRLIQRRFDTWEAEMELQPTEAMPRYAGTKLDVGIYLPTYPQANYTLEFTVLSTTYQWPLMVIDHDRETSAGLSDLVQPHGSSYAFPTRGEAPRVKTVSLRCLVAASGGYESLREVVVMASYFRYATRLLRNDAVLAVMPGNLLALESLTTEPTANPKYRTVSVNLRVVSIPEYVYALAYVRFDSGDRLVFDSGAALRF